MKLSISILILAICSSLVFGQSEDASRISDLMNIVEPEFVGTNENPGIEEFIKENLCTPIDQNIWGIEGTVVIRVNVLPTQNLSEFQVIQSVSPYFDQVVIDVLKASNGMWKPATIYGRPVAMEKEVTVVFRFEGTNFYQAAQLNKNNGDDLMKEGRYHRAVNSYSKALASCPVSDVLIYRRGLAKYYSGDLEGALIDFERVAYLDSHLADPMLTKLSELDAYAKNELQLSSLNY
jgi:tetratricopeptide (TPR) repeat protein